MRLPAPDRSGRAVALLILVQTACAVFFAGDVISDAVDTGRPLLADTHLVIEAVAVLALSGAVVVEIRFLMQMLRRAQTAARSLAVASGALWEVLESHFEHWGLTPAERDVAAFVIKGLSIAEIADLRSSRAGTVKSQLNAIYRKAGVGGRGQLVSLLIEDLLSAPLVAGRAGDNTGGGSIGGAS